MEKQRKNLFISHYGGDEKFIEPFKKMIGSQINVWDSSIVESNPNHASNEQYIKYKILAPKINWAGTMVVLIGPETKNREYVKWEIEYANYKGKPIVGVYLPGATEKDVPEELLKYGDSLVKWDEQKVVNAICGGTEWQTSTGEKRPNVQTRSIC